MSIYLDLQLFMEVTKKPKEVVYQYLVLQGLKGDAKERFTAQRLKLKKKVHDYDSLKAWLFKEYRVHEQASVKG